jgi:hypothetical protein
MTVSGKETGLINVIADYHAMLVKHKYPVGPLNKKFFEYASHL